MKTSQHTEEIVSSIYRIHAFASQVFGAVAYFKWVQPFEGVLNYSGHDEVNRLYFYLINCLAYMCLAQFCTYPFARLAAGVAREIDSLCKPHAKM